MTWETQAADLMNPPHAHNPDASLLLGRAVFFSAPPGSPPRTHWPQTRTLWITMRPPPDTGQTPNGHEADTMKNNRNLPYANGLKRNYAPGTHDLPPSGGHKCKCGCVIELEGKFRPHGKGGADMDGDWGIGFAKLGYRGSIQTGALISCFPAIPAFAPFDTPNRPRYTARLGSTPPGQPAGPGRTVLAPHRESTIPQHQARRKAQP